MGWKLEDGFGGGIDGTESAAFQERALRGHSHFVSDVTLSSDGQFALSGSWDATLRLWNLANGECTRRFVNHTKDVTSVAFSPDNRQIVSGSRDGTLKLWNTLGECKYTVTEGGHDGWVNEVRFSPNIAQPIIVSCGNDKLVKVWNLGDLKLRTNLAGHTGVVNSVTVSPDGSLCASGGKDGMAMLWDLSEGRLLYNLSADCGLRRWYSHPTVTGFALLLHDRSRSGTSRVRWWSMNCALSSPLSDPRPSRPSVSRCSGILTVLCSLQDGRTDRFAYGGCKST